MHGHRYTSKFIPQGVAATQVIVMARVAWLMGDAPRPPVAPFPLFTADDTPGKLAGPVWQGIAIG